MSKIVVLAEKPSVGRDIARVLKCHKKLNGALEGETYIVTWGLGHLVTLCDPEKYDEAYKEWKLSYLPMIPKGMKLEVIKQTGKQFQAVKQQLLRKDVSQVVIATDAGREGELVARWILEKSGCKLPMKRLWISSVTDKAIQEGFSKLKKASDYDHLYEAALCRAEADWLVGINATRALTCKYNAQLSCGRVQTPTLAMIAAREEEIRTFKPQSYYHLKAVVAAPKSCTLTWKGLNGKGERCFDKEKIEAVKKQCEHGLAKVVSVVKKQKKTYAPELYDLTELQREANQRYNFSAKETLNIMQRLYENHKVLTYPRTDSRYLTSDMADTLRDRILACGKGPYKKAAVAVMNQKFTSSLSCIDDKKVSDHHAIIPTEQYVQLDHMTNEERKIYDLVVKRFLAVLYPAYEYEQTTVDVSIGTETFQLKGNVVLRLGWKEVYASMEEEKGEEQIPVLSEGEQLSISRIELVESKTQPPAYFNEATLLTAMEKKGLGTVATRADIIEKLFSGFLVEKRGKDLIATSKAKQLLELVPDELRTPDLTADWERKLGKIAEGQMKQATFMSEIKGYTTELIEEIKTAQGKFRHDNITSQKCPECGKYLLLVKGKNATMKVCQDRECGYRETVSRTSNARCPKCHKKMELLGKGDAQTFKCACGYKEKLSSFQERRKKEGAGVSKKDVNRILKTMKKEEEPVNNMFAELLKKQTIR